MGKHADAARIVDLIFSCPPITIPRFANTSARPAQYMFQRRPRRNVGNKCLDGVLPALATSSADAKPDGVEVRPGKAVLVRAMGKGLFFALEALSGSPAAEASPRKEAPFAAIALPNPGRRRLSGCPVREPTSVPNHHDSPETLLEQIDPDSGGDLLRNDRGAVQQFDRLSSNHAGHGGVRLVGGGKRDQSSFPVGYNLLTP